MRYGTSYFPSREDVIKYYKPLGFSAEQAIEKINTGEVHIGKPPVPREHCAILCECHGDSLRYFIREEARID